MFLRYSNFGVFILLLLLALPLFAQNATAPAPREAPKHEYIVNAAELNLTPDQITKINDKVAGQQKAIAEWDIAHKEQLSKLAKEIEAKGKDAAAVAPLRAQQQALFSERTKLDLGLRKEMYEVLTLDQKLIWAGIRLYREREYGTMVKVLGLSADQDAKLKALAKTTGGELAKWEMENGEKARQLEKQIAEAKAALDAMKAPREKALQAQSTQFNAILTPEQHIGWRAYRLKQDMSSRFYKAKLTEEQLAKVKTLCDQAAKEMLAATDGSTIVQANEKLVKTITEQVLTAEQRTAMTQKPTPGAGH